MNGDFRKGGRRRVARWSAVLLLAGVAWSGVVSAKRVTHKTTTEEDRPPVVLDTQTGIHDGQSGTVLQTAPLNRAPIVEPAQIRQPAELQQGDQTPIVVAPYVRAPASSGYRQ